MSAERFDPERSNFTRHMAAGHEIRCGHVLAGYYAPTADAGITRLVRTCCGEHEGSDDA